MTPLHSEREGNCNKRSDGIKRHQIKIKREMAGKKGLKKIQACKNKIPTHIDGNKN